MNSALIFATARMARVTRAKRTSICIHRRWKSSNVSAAAASEQKQHDDKCPMTADAKEKDLNHDSSTVLPPGPSKIDCVKAMFSGEMSNRTYLEDIRTKYNTDTPLIWLFQDATQIFDPDIWMNSVLRKEWKLPYGAAPQTWPFQIYYRQLKCDVNKGDRLPVMLTHGEDEWRRPRHAIQTHLFSPKAADSYQSSIQEVADDASRFLSLNDGQNSIPNLEQFSQDVSFEMLAMVMLDRRMGLLDKDTTTDNKKSEEEQFVNSSVESFHALGALLMKPPIENLTLLRTFSSDWNKLEKNMDIVWDIGMKWIVKAEVDGSPRAFVNKLQTQVDGDDTLTMDRQERLVNLLTLLQAGVDTTSNSILWAMIELARRPRVQRRLRRELEETMGGNFSRTEDLPNLPYLKAFLREIQRFSPTAGGNMRRLPFDVTIPSTNPNGDNDKKQEDYVVEKNSLILFSQEVYGFDPKLLGGDPDEFLPERWLAAEHVLSNAKTDKSMDLDPRTPLEVDLTSIDFDFGDELATAEDESSSSAVTMNTGTIMAPAPILSNPLMSSPFSVGPRMCVGARYVDVLFIYLFMKLQ
jgi:cytochrome P450